MSFNTSLLVSGVQRVSKRQFGDRQFLVIVGQMGIPHGRLDVGMAEQFLDRHEIHTVHHQVGRKGMAQDVGGEVCNSCILAESLVKARGADRVACLSHHRTRRNWQNAGDAVSGRAPDPGRCRWSGSFCSWSSNRPYSARGKLCSESRKLLLNGVCVVVIATSVV